MKKGTSTHSLKLNNETKDYLTKYAEKNMRSLHGEILLRLHRTIEQDNLSSKCVDELPDSIELSEDAELHIIELFKQLRRDQESLVELLNSNDFAKKLFKRGFASVLK